MRDEAIMAVPKTSVDKDHGAEPWEHYVGGTGEAPRMQTKTKASTVQSSPCCDLWFRVERTNRSHIAAPLRGRRGERGQGFGILSPAHDCDLGRSIERRSMVRHKAIWFPTF